MMTLTLVSFLLFVLKAFVVVMFAMNVAVILTWADRRQGAMIQDRVGPNRAVAWIPTKVAQAIAVGPALAVIAGVAFVVLKLEPPPEELGQRAMLFSQLGILFTWLTGVVIACKVQIRGVTNSFDAWLYSLGDPRRIFYGGLFAHFLALFVGLALNDSAFGEQVRAVGYGAGAGLLILSVLFGALYAAISINGEPRVGLRLAGLLHPAADGLKTIFKEDFIPPNADKFLHSLAPFISFFPALVVMAVIPFGDTLCFSLAKDGSLGSLMTTMPRAGVCTEGAFRLQVVDLDVGLLYFFALAGTGIVGAALAGWASDNKYSLLGGVRAASQMVSYEVTMGLTLVGAVMVYGTLRVDQMIEWQSQNAWGIFVQPLAFFLFFTASVAESKRIPFDIPEGESEIVAGYFTEYAGMKFAMFFFAEYIAVVTSAGLMSAIFLGGWDLPFLYRDGLHVTIGQTVIFEQALPHLAIVLIGALGFVLKTLTLCWLQLMIRWTLPRFRYDQLMRLGWRKLLPASLANVVATGLIVMAIVTGGPAVATFMSLLADYSKALVALAGFGGFIYFIVFLVKPVHKRQSLASSSAQFAAAAGGTRS
ncbi:MAG TPA: complex I subunit 1 family protein, partial [Polyangiaceae bacterium]